MTKEQLIKSAKFNLETLQMLNISLQKHLESEEIDVRSVYASIRAMDEHLGLLVENISAYCQEETK